MFCYINETTDEPQHLPDVLLGIMLPQNSSNLSCRDKGSDPEGPVGCSGTSWLMFNQTGSNKRIE